MLETTTSLLQTRFFTPPIRPNLVLRLRLLQQLDDGLEQQRPFTLVSAPAGYGKTTLIAAWLQQPATRINHAWLALSASDNDPIRFLEVVAATLQQNGLILNADEHRLWQMNPPPPMATLITTLLNAAARDDAARDDAAPKLALVLDDYHKIETPAVHDLLRFWLEHAPPTLHLIVITREDPPLGLARLRASNHMTEIRANALRFTTDEAADFLQRTMNLALPSDSIAALERRTEGWITGLQLAAFALQSSQTAQLRTDSAEFIAEFSGSHHYIIDYLVEEVLRQEDEDVHDFLLNTAPLERLCAPLCDAVTGRDNSRDMLAYLEQSNFFLVPLDNRRHWYRYHHLLADSLRAELPREQQRETLRRAAVWCASEGDYSTAIEYADAADDKTLVAQFVCLASEDALQAGDIGRITNWLSLLSHDQIVADPTLGVLWLVSLILTGRSREADTAITELERYVPHWDNPRQIARLQVIKAWIADIMSSEQRVTLAHEAASALRDTDPLFKAFVAVPLAHAHLYQGALSQAMTVLQQGLTLIFTRGASFIRLSLLCNLINMLNYAGNRREAWAVCQDTITEYVDPEGDPLPAAGLPYILSAWLHYDVNRLERTRVDLTRGTALIDEAFGATMLTPLDFELTARLQIVAGETDGALATVLAGLERASAQRYRHGVTTARRMKAELHLRRGELVAVRQWAEGLPVIKALESGHHFAAYDGIHDDALLIFVRLLLAEERVEQAQQVLSELIAVVREGERGRSLISCLLLQAVVSAKPLAALNEALQRASAAGYVRLIIDECTYPAHGTQLATLLHQQETITDDRFRDAVLAALPSAESHPLQTSNLLLEPLTDQELVIVRLLADGRSNREIASELVITIGTAKWHVHNIYQKLDVSSRAEAVARIHAWHLAA